MKGAPLPPRTLLTYITKSFFVLLLSLSVFTRRFLIYVCGNMKFVNIYSEENQLSPKIPSSDGN